MAQGEYKNLEAELRDVIFIVMPSFAYLEFIPMPFKEHGGCLSVADVGIVRYHCINLYFDSFTSCKHLDQSQAYACQL